LAHEVSVSDSDTDEVRVAGEEDDRVQELSEDVVLLLELEVAGFRGSPSVVDVFLLVNPDEVDHGPGGNEGSGDDDEDASAEESATSGDVVLSEPDNEEGSSGVSGKVEADVDEWVPPLNLIVEHEEELLRDLDGNEGHGENSNESDTGLQGYEDAAGLTFGEGIRTVADAAAALRIDRSVIGLSIGVGIISRSHCGRGIGIKAERVLIFLLLFLRFVVLLIIFLIFIGLLILRGVLLVLSNQGIFFVSLGFFSSLSWVSVL